MLSGRLHDQRSGGQQGQQRQAAALIPSANLKRRVGRALELALRDTAQAGRATR